MFYGPNATSVGSLENGVDLDWSSSIIAFCVLAGMLVGFALLFVIILCILDDDFRHEMCCKLRWRSRDRIQRYDFLYFPDDPDRDLGMVSSTI